MQEIIQRISDWLADQVKAAGAGGLVVGLSGGIDSACTLALSKRAMGANVLGVLMPCHSAPIDAEYAMLAAEAFDVETITVDLSPAYDLLLSMLPPAEKLVAANIKPRLRMTTLYYLAASRNYLVAGTGNKSELMIGYFTKYGDGGVDLEPLGELLKAQVWELGRALDVPQPIIDRPPTAGLWAGQTDEGEIDISYPVLDQTLEAIITGETASVAPHVLKRVERMIRGSEHKRRMPPVCDLHVQY